MDWAIIITGKCWWEKWMEKNGASHRHHHQHHQCLWIWFQMFGGSTLWFWVGWPHRFDPFLHRSWFQASKRLPVRVSMTCSIVKHIVTWCWGPAIPPEIGYLMARIMHQPSSESWPTHSTPTVGWTWLWQRRNHGRGNWHSQMKMGEMGKLWETVWTPGVEGNKLTIFLILDGTCLVLSTFGCIRARHKKCQLMQAALFNF